MEFLIVGMAGSGKTSFCQRLYNWLLDSITQGPITPDKIRNNLHTDILSINLDPNVLNTKMPCSLDIRDHIDYPGVMKKYNLGPNGAINTCLNLFLLKDVKFTGKKFSIIDTPGQIEAIVWSSPGNVIINQLKNPVIIFMCDINQNLSNTNLIKLKNDKNTKNLSKDKNDYLHSFLINLLLASSLKDRFKIPVIFTFSKSDINNFDYKKYLDYEYLREITNNEKYCSLGNLSTYFDEYFKELDFLCLSSKTGKGKDQLFEIIKKYQKEN